MSAFVMFVISVYLQHVQKWFILLLDFSDTCSKGGEDMALTEAKIKAAAIKEKGIQGGR